MKRLKKFKEVIILIFRDIERKHLLVVAAGVAYYFLTSLFPALVLLTAVVAYIPLKNTMQGATVFMGYVMPPQSLALLERVLATVTPHRGGLLSFGIISTLWLASVGIKGVIAGLDIVYDVRVPRSLWLNRLLAFGLALGVGALMLLGVVLTLAGPILENMIPAAAPLHSLWITLWPYVQWSVSALSILAAIELLYLLAPNAPLAHRTTIPGAIIAACAWLALSWGLGFYFAHFGGLKLDKMYGILATPIAVMVWLYWGATAILVGAEINVALQFHKRLRSPVPERVLQRRIDAA